MEHLPADPAMLLSVINTKLRDFYPSLDALCEDLGIAKQELTETLEQLDYHYSTKKNKFI